MTPTDAIDILTRLATRVYRDDAEFVEAWRAAREEIRAARLLRLENDALKMQLKKEAHDERNHGTN